MPATRHAAVTPGGIRDGEPAALAALVERRAQAVLGYCAVICAPQDVVPAAAEAFARFRAAVATMPDARALDPERLLLGATRHAAAAVADVPRQPPAPRPRRRLRRGAGASPPDPRVVAGLLAAGAGGELAPDEAVDLDADLEAHPGLRDLATRTADAEAAYRAPSHAPVPIGALVEILAALTAAAPVVADPGPERYTWSAAEPAADDEQRPPAEPSATQADPPFAGADAAAVAHVHAPEPAADRDAQGLAALDGAALAPLPGDGAEPAADLAPEPAAGMSRDPVDDAVPAPGEDLVADPLDAVAPDPGDAVLLDPGEAVALDPGDDGGSAPLEDDLAAPPEHDALAPVEDDALAPVEDDVVPAVVAAATTTATTGVALPRPARRLHLPHPGLEHGPVFRFVLPGAAIVLAALAVMAIAGVFSTSGAAPGPQPRSVAAAATATVPAPVKAAPGAAAQRRAKAQTRARRAAASRRRARRAATAAAAARLRARARRPATGSSTGTTTSTAAPATSTPAVAPSATGAASPPAPKAKKAKTPATTSTAQRSGGNASLPGGGSTTTTGADQPVFTPTP